jgi:hypothetical protein
MTQFYVDDHSELSEIREIPSFPQPLRFIAKVVSYIFHPLFIPVYISWFLVRIQPYLFASFSEWDKIIVMLRFFVMYAMFPLVTILLAKGLGFIQSIYLRTQRERIIPYMACGVYYFWMWYVLRNQSEFPSSMVDLSFAIFLASSAGLMANIYMKVSMHALSLGVMSTFMAGIAFNQDMNFGIYLSAAIFITGLVCTARLIVSDHTQKEIYVGLLVGILCQVVSFMI